MTVPVWAKQHAAGMLASRARRRRVVIGGFKQVYRKLPTVGEWSAIIERLREPGESDRKSLLSVILLGEAERCDATIISEKKRRDAVCDRKCRKPIFDRRDYLPAVLLAGARKNPRL